MLLSHAILPALADAAPAANPSLASPAGLEAVAHLVSALAWPAIVVAILLIFRVPIAALLPKVQEIQIGSFKAKLVDALEEAGQNVEKGSGKSGEPTHSELKQAYAVEALADPADIGILRAQAQALGTEYEKVRNTMRPGNARTLEMEKVVAKMRVLGRAAFGLRHEFSASASPGLRLQAVAILQVLPDPDYLDWLVDRVGQERPFIGYHAAVALLAAVRNEHAADWIGPLQQAAERSKTLTYEHSSDTDREKRIEEFRQLVMTLQGVASAPR
jgi:hypothetical protein